MPKTVRKTPAPRRQRKTANPRNVRRAAVVADVTPDPAVVAAAEANVRPGERFIPVDETTMRSVYL